MCLSAEGMFLLCAVHCHYGLNESPQYFTCAVSFYEKAHDILPLEMTPKLNTDLLNVSTLSFFGYHPMILFS